jgi:hypothetical protein
MTSTFCHCQFHKYFGLGCTVVALCWFSGGPAAKRPSIGVIRQAGSIKPQVRDTLINVSSMVIMRQKATPGQSCKSDGHVVNRVAWNCVFSINGVALVIYLRCYKVENHIN